MDSTNEVQNNESPIVKRPLVLTARQPVMFFASGAAFGVGLLLLGQEMINPQKAEAKEPSEYVAATYTQAMLPDVLADLARPSFGNSDPNATEASSESDIEVTEEEAKPCVVMPQPQIGGTVRPVGMRSGVIPDMPSMQPQIKVEPVRPVIPTMPSASPKASKPGEKKESGATPPPPETQPDKTAPPKALPPMHSQVVALAKRFGGSMLPIDSVNQRANILIKKSTAGRLIEELTDLGLSVSQSRTDSGGDMAAVNELERKLDDLQKKRTGAEGEEATALDKQIEATNGDLSKARAKQADVMVTLTVSLKSST